MTTGGQFGDNGPPAAPLVVMRPHHSPHRPWSGLAQLLEGGDVDLPDNDVQTFSLSAGGLGGQELEVLLALVCADLLHLEVLLIAAWDAGVLRAGAKYLDVHHIGLNVG